MWSKKKGPVRSVVSRHQVSPDFEGMRGGLVRRGGQGMSSRPRQAATGM
jgi:hypothetical protein